MCKSANNAKSLRDVVLLLMRLERYRNDKLNGKDSLAEMVSQYYSDIKDMAAEYMVKWQKDTASFMLTAMTMATELSTDTRKILFTGTKNALKQTERCLINGFIF